MKDVVVIGAGKIGVPIAGLLASTGDYKVTLADRSPEVLGRLNRDERFASRLRMSRTAHSWSIC
jgi:saccharopine dehydrogenase-like NADP-dependent oxidoreductase